ncbi:MAG: GGDEF domain-containing protein [Tatlockia sp.]|nr:GGDEF domain-containing protein [Tatlockia sp.]
MHGPKENSQIVSTLSKYKVKCNKLEDEINVLKSAIYQLSLLPNSIYVGLDRQMHNLQNNIQENQNSSKIKKSVELLVNAMSEIRHKKQVNKVDVSEFIKKATTILGKMIVTVKDQKTYENIQKIILAETDEQALLVQFAQVLDDSVNWVNEQLNFCQQNHSQLIQQKDISKLTLSNQLNIRLSQLTKHLLIPDLLANKLIRLKANLAKELTLASLGTVVDNLTDLVIEAFNLEHNHLKGFLNIFASNLQDFDSYLQLSTHNSYQTELELKQLEQGIQGSIQAIKGQLKIAKNLNSLAPKVEDNLELITKQIKVYHQLETKRIKNFKQKISSLKAKLTETESIVDNIRNQLASHKIKVNRDFLTGLPDRVAYEEYLIGAFHRWQRGYGEVAIGLVNIDHFRIINEKYGYQAGDQILKQLATLLRSTLRAVDFIARYDGEEFIIILEHASALDALKVLENLRIIIEESQFCYFEEKLALTVSFGLSSFQPKDSIETLTMRLVEAMNQAKHSGRNQVILS